MAESAKAPKKPQTAKWKYVVLLGSVAVAYAAFVYLPRQQHISALRDEINLMQTTIDSEAALDAQLKAVGEEVDQVEEFLAPWHAVSEKDIDAGRVYHLLTAQARAAGAEKLSLVPMPEQRHASLVAQPVQIGCQAKFAQIHEMLKRFEELPYVLWVRSIELSPLAPNEDTLQCELTLEFFVDFDGKSG
ncbi:type 4a pilus biogenesis protein PilO [Blastopirellula sp. JC732]|uniref:Type 4a pilus biogenesis protein PilO n=1 Tax=Blastopirellula sediminis TaxID=2894196 RepID=A0A9X1MV23_9BACT|nr:type 4a pilus biogenesis protein PilO [Blastopirellula sediminis]MCC9604552.1 type 4a pilus biogenesis protein PilO [Blastopirellula sediminis]MCC9632149.1 type 4a pilus biogenesis protein PilO [Blastopirellula sediminis]